MAKKSTKRTQKVKHVSLSPTHVMIKRSIVSYAVLVFLLFATIAFSWYLIDRMVTSKVNQVRYDHISAIYTSLNLGDSYRVVNSNVFGDKRVYEWDKGRSFSSKIEYGHNDTVTNTFADLRKKIEAAGFTYVQSEYTGTVAQKDEYKNSDGAYVRVNVESDDIHDMLVYGTPKRVADIANTDAAPSYVTVRVNLDDNND